MNDTEKAKYKVTPEGIDMDLYLENCILGGHKYLLKSKKPADFEKGKRIIKIVSYF
jgi:hypothetical protein